MENIFKYLSVVYLLCNIAQISAQTLNFRNYTVDNGLANSTVYYIHQDSKGFIWLATESGVNRYDGKNFQTFTMDDGLSDNEVLQIHEDTKGRTWFLTLNGKLSYYYKNKFYNAGNDTLLSKTICKASFINFFEDSKKRLWFSTNQRELLMIDGEKATFFYSAKQALANSYIAENEKAEVLIFNKNSLYTFKNQKFTERKLKFNTLNFRTVSYQKSNKTVLFLSETGLVRYKNGKDSLVQNISAEILNNGITNFFSDSENKIWINTMGNGAYLLDKAGNAAKHFLKGKYITHSLLDTDGNTWISTIGDGLYMLPSSAKNMRHFTTNDGLKSNAIHSIIKTPTGELVLGLNNGEVNIIAGNDIINRKLEGNNFTFNPIKKLFYDKSNGSVWFASNSSLGEITTKYGIRYLRERDNLTYSLKSFSISKSGQLAVAMAGGVDILQNKNEPLIFESPNLTDPSLHFPTRAYSVFYDSKERLWFSNINGLQYIYNKNLVQLYSLIPQLKQRITDITELPDGTIVCASYGFGVFFIKNGQMRATITTENGLESNICKKVFYSDDYIWVITGKGISRISFDLKTIDNYKKDNGLLSDEINDAIVQNDTLYVASNNGLSILPTTIEQKKNYPLKLNLNYVLIDNKKVNIAEKLVLDYKSNHLTINFIGIDFNNPDYVVYQYRLNKDQEWNQTSNTTIEFGSIESGEYNLEIRAKSINSQWSEPIAFSFTINPPLWKKPWFVILLMLILGPCVLWIINSFYKNRRIKEQEKLLAKTKIIALEQQALQAMMNPHFIFNVMNSIQHFINTKDTVMANQLLTGFARLIRKNLDICNKSYISIEEELSYLTLYLSLEKLRFGDKMSYHIEVDPELDKEETLIPSMLLQPFVENAIWHGIMPKETNGNISIAIKINDGNMLHICIEDDGIGIENSYKLKSNDHISRGMALTQERIHLLNKFEAQIAFYVTNLQPQGTRVTIFIPFDR